MKKEEKLRKSRKERRESVRGRLVRELYANITAAGVIGKKIRTGEYRRNPVEPKWHCPSGYSLTTVDMERFTMEWLEPKQLHSNCAVLQLHGGGYIGPMKNIYRSFAVRYSEALGGGNVLTIDYRVAPANPYPAALEDACTAYEWLLNRYPEKQIILAGDSAGGGLALALCMWLRDQGRSLPRGIITMSAWTDLTCSGDSYAENYELDPLFGNAPDSMLYNGDYVGESDPTDPYISPLYGEYNGFPPMLMQVGTYEMLLDDTLNVARKAEEQNVKVKLSVYEGMFHVFQMAGSLIPESDKAWKEVGRFLAKLCKTGKEERRQSEI
ncbi:alpha/beta hydrolase [Anaerolentibacter hominis]|uniref:alpha/beta hydrolase n=1 Tax=Anaerolentibacter hominis TaxID=3079009 RepID=UPI0031B84498